MFTIRPLTEEEIPAVQALEALCFPDPWSAKGLRDTLREDCSCFLGAWNGAFRRQGAAGQLFSALDEFCRKKGIIRFFLEVRESNLPAQVLYKGLGFLPIGTRPNFYENPTEGAVLMYRIFSEQA